MTRILAVDVGNTRAKFGVFEIGHAARPQPRKISAVRLAKISGLADELNDWLETGDFDDVSSSIVAGSNPPVRDHMVADWPWSDVPPRVVNSHTDIPLQIDVDAPEAIGIDRLLTAWAARRLFSEQQPIIVVDSGTATTINLTTSDGTFRGGAILPGLRLSSYALHDYTARLPQIDADSLSVEPNLVDPPIPGRNTVDAIKSGLFWGQLGAVREISDRLAIAAANEFGDSRPVLQILTGGGGRQLASHLPNATYIDSLALHGLALLAAERV